MRGHGEAVVSNIREDEAEHVQIHAGVSQTGGGQRDRPRWIGKNRGGRNPEIDRGANHPGRGRKGECRCVGTAGGGGNFIPRGRIHRDVPCQVVGGDGDPLRIGSGSRGVIEAVRRKVGRQAGRIVHDHHTRSTRKAGYLITTATTSTSCVGCAR